MIDPNEVKALAIKGVQQEIQRLNELLAELAQHRGPGRKPRQSTALAFTATLGGEPVKRAARKPMSAAAKKAVGERMKKYWAERKKDKSSTKGKA